MSTRTNTARHQPAADVNGILATLADLIGERVAARLGQATDARLRHASTPSKEPDFLSEQEVARRSSISPRTLQTWRLRGGGPPFVKAGRKVLYPTVQLESWLRSEASK